MSGGGFLDPLLSGALTVDTTTWFSPSLPNGQCQKFQLTTSDSTTSVLGSIGRVAGSLSDDKTTTIYVVVIANQQAGLNAPDGAEYQLKGVWQRNAGALTVIKAPTVVDSNPNANGTAWTAELVANGTAIDIEVTGDTSKTIVWSAIVTFYEG